MRPPSAPVGGGSGRGFSALLVRPAGCPRSGHQHIPGVRPAAAASVPRPQPSLTHPLLEGNFLLSPFFFFFPQKKKKKKKKEKKNHSNIYTLVVLGWISATRFRSLKKEK